MPTLTGWDFLDEYEKFGENIKRPISIYLLSSSIDRRDWDKAKENKNVKGFLVKPMYRETILSIVEKEFWTSTFVYLRYLKIGVIGMKSPHPLFPDKFYFTQYWYFISYVTIR